MVCDIFLKVSVQVHGNEVKDFEVFSGLTKTSKSLTVHSSSFFTENTNHSTIHNGHFIHHLNLLSIIIHTHNPIPQNTSIHNPRHEHNAIIKHNPIPQNTSIHN
eukprot:309617_1